MVIDRLLYGKCCSLPLLIEHDAVMEGPQGRIVLPWTRVCCLRAFVLSWTSSFVRATPVKNLKRSMSAKIPGSKPVVRCRVPETEKVGMTWLMVKHSIATGPELQGLNGAPASKVESRDARGINLASECPVQQRELEHDDASVALVVRCCCCYCSVVSSVAAAGKTMSPSHVVVPVHSSAWDGTESVTVC